MPSSSSSSTQSSSSNEQNYANHVRYHAPFHFFVVPVLAITLLLAIRGVFQNQNFNSVWILVLVITGAVAVFLTRIYALRVQDRVIRLEEQLRLAMLLPEAQRSRIGDLSTRQLVALRFACDAEAPALVEKTLANKMAPAEIKKAIVTWRGDTLRV